MIKLEEIRICRLINGKLQCLESLKKSYKLKITKINRFRFKETNSIHHNPKKDTIRFLYLNKNPGKI